VSSPRASSAPAQDDASNTAEARLAIDGGALRISPLHNPGWGRCAVAYKAASTDQTHQSSETPR
jgi:hypothetical protein